MAEVDLMLNRLHTGSAVRRLAEAAIVAAGVLAMGSEVLAAGSFVVRDYGAVGDGLARDTAAIQAAVDACHAAGGGEVVLPAGRYLSGSLLLRTGVRLMVLPDAVLLGSTHMEDFPNGKLIHAVDAERIGIGGGGIIDGQGPAFWERKAAYTGPSWRGTAQFEYRALRRPSFIHFVGCSRVDVRDITLRNAPSWTLHLQRCTGAVVERVTIRNPLHGPNTDGIDLNSCIDVQVRDCDIITGDDGVVLKSLQPGHDFPSRDIVVEGCRIWSACNALKIGTETHGSFDRITFRHCHLYGGSDNPLERPLSGVAIESVDGAPLADILVEDITMEAVRAPIFVRLGHRGGNSERTRQVEPRVPGSIRNVVIRRVAARRACFESSITGIPGHPVTGVVLEDLDLEYVGGGTEAMVGADVPDETVVRSYPEAQMFGRLPAYGLYCRHVEGLRLTRVRCGWQAEDGRPMLVCDRVRGLVLRRLEVTVPPPRLPVVWLIDTSGAEIMDCVVPSGARTFVAAETPAGADPGIILAGNALAAGTTSIVHLASGGLLAQDLPLVNERSPGLVVVEAEALYLSPPMAVLADAGARGGQAVWAPRGSGRDTGTARCRFTVSRSGDYVIAARVFAEDGESDSFHATIDSASPALSDVLTHGTWHWDWVRDRLDGRTVREAVRVFHLTAGEHLLRLGNRESGTRIDSIAVVKQDLDFDPRRDLDAAAP